MKRVHIVGCPRSGTTLMMELLSTCFASSGYCDHEMSIFEPVATDTTLYFSKQPNDIKFIQHIFERDPQLYIIYMGRDPRAVICSKHRETSRRYFCNYRVWSECDRAARRYAQSPRLLSLRYEDLVANPDAVQSTIATHFPFLQQLHRFSQYQDFAQPSAGARRAMNGLRAVNSDSLHKWRQHLPWLKHQWQLHPELADDTVRLGYENHRDWVQVFQDSVSSAAPCRYPERRGLLKHWEQSVRLWFKSRRYLQRRGLQ